LHDALPICMSGYNIDAEYLDRAPSSIDELLMQAANGYDKILGTNADCENLSKASYDQCAVNTTAARADNWAKDVSEISSKISGNLILFANAGSGGTQTSNNNGNTGIDLNIDPDNLKGTHIIDLNNALNRCTTRDMDLRFFMLHKRTGIRFFYLTKTLGYFLPRDSQQVFIDAATAGFTTNTTNDEIIALYLKMKDT